MNDVSIALGKPRNLQLMGKCRHRIVFFYMQSSVNIDSTLQENKNSKPVQNVGFLKCYAYKYQDNSTLNSCMPEM